MPPLQVASTGHVDRYERLQRQRSLKNGTPGVAVIEYEDGEREMVDMKIEKFRSIKMRLVIMNVMMIQRMAMRMSIILIYWQ